MIFNNKVVIFLMVSFFIFNLFAEQEKGKLYFEGTKVVNSAIVNIHEQFASVANKTIDTELFVSRIMPFMNNEKKTEFQEKRSRCNNPKCKIRAAAESGVSLIVTSEISFASNSFKGTLTMTDTEYGTIVAEISKTASVENPEKIYVKMVKELITEAQYFFSLKRYTKKIDHIEGFSSSPFNPFVDLKLYSNDSGIKQEGIPARKNIFPPEKMSEFHDLGDKVGKDVIIAYENALRADRHGEETPLKAYDAWKKVYELSDLEKIKNFALVRANKWFGYNQEVKETESFRKNIVKEKEKQFFPDLIIEMWQKFLVEKPIEERAVYARKRIEVYSKRAKAIKKYVEEKNSLTAKAKAAYLKNIKAMSLELIQMSSKIDLLIKFIETYGVVDTDFYFLEKLINGIPSKSNRTLARKNLYNKWIAEFFRDKCVNMDSGACIISERIFRKIGEKTKAVKLQDEGCERGVLELCALSAETKLNRPNDLRLEELAEKSCFMGSGLGCFVLSEFYKIAVMKKPKVKKELLYEVSCRRGYKPACPLKAKPVFSGLPLIKNKADFPKKPVNSKKNKKKTSGEFLKTHPYFWYGFSSLVVGTVLGITSISYGVKANDKYDTFNEKIEEESLLYVSENFSYSGRKIYVNEVTALKDDGDKYKKIAIGTGIVGGALFITGVVLMAVKKSPKEEKTMITFIPSKQGFMLGASFRY